MTESGATIPGSDHICPVSRTSSRDPRPSRRPAGHGGPDAEKASYSSSRRSSSGLFYGAFVGVRPAVPVNVVGDGGLGAGGDHSRAAKRQEQPRSHSARSPRDRATPLPCPVGLSIGLAMDARLQTSAPVHPSRPLGYTRGRDIRPTKHDPQSTTLDPEPAFDNIPDSVPRPSETSVVLNGSLPRPLLRLRPRRAWPRPGRAGFRSTRAARPGRGPAGPTRKKPHEGTNVAAEAARLRPSVSRHEQVHSSSNQRSASLSPPPRESSRHSSPGPAPPQQIQRQCLLFLAQPTPRAQDRQAHPDGGVPEQSVDQRQNQRERAPTPARHVLGDRRDLSQR